MTTPDTKLSPEDLLKQRKEEGFMDMGFHRLISRTGKVAKLIPLTSVGSHTTRYSESSIGILLVGGKDSFGKAISSYTLEQLVSLGEQVKEIQEIYPNAKAVGYQDLYSGSNPGFSVTALMEAE